MATRRSKRKLAESEEEHGGRGGEEGEAGASLPGRRQRGVIEGRELSPVLNMTQRDAGRGVNYAGIGSISNPASCHVALALRHIVNPALVWRVHVHV